MKAVFFECRMKLGGEPATEKNEWVGKGWGREEDGKGREGERMGRKEEIWGRQRRVLVTKRSECKGLHS
jgi:hypothetical protein